MRYPERNHSKKPQYQGFCRNSTKIAAFLIGTTLCSYDIINFPARHGNVHANEIQLKNDTQINLINENPQKAWNEIKNELKKVNKFGPCVLYSFRDLGRAVGLTDTQTLKELVGTYGKNDFFVDIARGTFSSNQFFDRYLNPEKRFIEWKPDHGTPILVIAEFTDINSSPYFRHMEIIKGSTNGWREFLDKWLDMDCHIDIGSIRIRTLRNPIKK